MAFSFDPTAKCSKNSDCHEWYSTSFPGMKPPHCQFDKNSKIGTCAPLILPQAYCDSDASCETNSCINNVCSPLTTFHTVTNPNPGPGPTNSRRDACERQMMEIASKEGTFLGCFSACEPFGEAAPACLASCAALQVGGFLGSTAITKLCAALF